MILSSQPQNLWPTAGAFPRVGVARRDGHYRLLARDTIPALTPILEIDGIYVDRPSRYSVQVAADVHVEPPAAVLPDLDIERYRWRFLNHSCEPNSVMRGQLLVALNAIEPWDEITFNYDTTEYEMAERFTCHCGHCDGRQVAGFRFLEPELQRRLSPLLADHLRPHLMPIERTLA